MDKPNKPSDTDFKQQRLQGLVFTPSSLVLGVIYLSIGISFIVFGIIVLEESSKVEEVSKRYDDIDECQANWRTPRTCTITMDLESSMEAPIFFYYEIRNMFQNHRRFNKNRDIFQLMGEDLNVNEIDQNCDPVVDMDDLGFYTSLDLDGNDPANPCGLFAKAYFNDTFSLLSQNSPNEEIPIEQSGIAWDIDKEDKFQRVEGWQGKQWIDIENEHFIVWMSTAGLPRFRKIWGRIEEDLESGSYQLVIVNNYDVSSFDGQKHIVMSTTSAFGGKADFLGVLYIVVGVLAMLGALVIFLTYYLKTRT